MKIKYIERFWPKGFLQSEEKKRERETETHMYIKSNFLAGLSGFIKDEHKNLLS